MRLGAAALLGVLSLLAPRVALADRSALTLLPVATPAPSEGQPSRALAEEAEELSAVLGDAAYDQGFELAATNGAALATQPPADDALIEKARGGWIVSPRLEASGNQVLLRLVAVAPGSRVLLVRSERMDPKLLGVRAVLMLRDLLEAGSDQPRASTETPAVGSAAFSAEGPEPRSAGRAVLALNAAVLGGYIGVSLQKASGSDDERLIYPLAALGAGIGLGASLLVADEWDIGVGDAWFVAAGAWWPVAGGLLLAQSYDVAPEDRYVYGIVGAAAGVASATAAVALAPMSEGGATVAHSGGAFGLGLGGLGELLVEGNTDATPVRGMGYGAISGVVLGGALATQVRAPTSRVLLIDLGASLGALSGAAAASPLLIVEEDPHPTRTRIWLSSVALGTVAGGTLAWWLTRGGEQQATLPFVPYASAWPDGDGRAGAKLGITGSF
jgi:hypothetical protein